MDVPTRRTAVPEQLWPLVASSLRDLDQRQAVRCVLADLQAQARAVFATSGETVDGFLRERRDEARREVGA